MKSPLRLLLMTVLIGAIIGRPLTAQYTSVQNVQSKENTIDTLDKNRLTALLITGGLAYAGTSAGLYHAWYRDYPQSGFHLYDDSREWLQMDKVGHVYSSYQQADLTYQALRWTGLDDRRSVLYGVLAGGLFQSTIEIFDGFSSEWGFSLADMGANVAGLGTWYLQQRSWGEQRIRVKYSAHLPSYPTISHSSTVIDLSQRAIDLYGSSIAQRLLKDYNAQTYWLSANVQSLTGLDMPPWLNVAIGYGSQNLYGGYDNVWTTGADQLIDLQSTLHDRYRQYYLSLDIDLSRIKTDLPWLRTLLRLLNVVKIPMPALELSRSGVRVHGLH